MQHHAYRNVPIKLNTPNKDLNLEIIMEKYIDLNQIAPIIGKHMFSGSVSLLVTAPKDPDLKPDRTGNDL